MNDTPALDVLRAKEAFKTATWGNALGTLAGVGAGGLLGGAGGAALGLSDVSHDINNASLMEQLQLHQDPDAFVNARLMEHMPADIGLGAAGGAAAGGALGYLASRPSPAGAPQPTQSPGYQA